MNYPYLYAYATGRDDGFAVAVGIVESDGARADGSFALFQTTGDAALFGRAYAESRGGSYADLPSVLNSALLD
jgi:hypothetical protein